MHKQNHAKGPIYTAPQPLPGAVGKDLHHLPESVPNPGQPPALLAVLLRNLQGRFHDPVCRYQGKDVTGGMLLHKSDSLRNALAKRGIGAGDHVGVAVARSPDSIVVILALWQLGAVYIPLDSTMPKARLLAMTEAGKLSHILLAPDLQDSFNCLSLPQILLAPIDYRKYSQGPGLHKPGPAKPLHDIAYMVFTSGSTGLPKAVAVSHGNLQVLIASIHAVLPLPSRFRLLGCTNPGFDIVWFEWLAPIFSGGTLILADEFASSDITQLSHLILTEHVNVIQSTPSRWRLLLQHNSSQALELDLAISTGEALDRTLAAQLLPHSRALWNLYGPTECTVWASAYHVQPADLTDKAPECIPLGYALPDYDLCLQTLSDSDSGSGELLIKGPAVAAGYFHATDQQRSRFSSPDKPGECWQYATADRCARDSTGCFHYLGRLDSQVKYNGYRIDLEEIAYYLRRHGCIADARCILNTDNSHGVQLLAFVLWRAGEPNKNQQQLHAHLARWLPQWMLPQRYIPLPGWPLGPNGKPDSQALLAAATRFNPHSMHRQQGRNPSDKEQVLHDPDSDPDTRALHTEVARIFCELLELPEIATGDSFFDMGGNSMLAATLVMRINDSFGSSLSFREVLACPPTVLRIVQLLQHCKVDTSTGETRSSPAS